MPTEGSDSSPLSIRLAWIKFWLKPGTSWTPKQWVLCIYFPPPDNPIAHCLISGFSNNPLQRCNIAPFLVCLRSFHHVGVARVCPPPHLTHEPVHLKDVSGDTWEGGKSALSLLSLALFRQTGKMLPSVNFHRNKGGGAGQGWIHCQSLIWPLGRGKQDFPFCCWFFSPSSPPAPKGSNWPRKKTFSMKRENATWNHQGVNAATIRLPWASCWSRKNCECSLEKVAHSGLFHLCEF